MGRKEVRAFCLFVFTCRNLHPENNEEDEQERTRGSGSGVCQRVGDRDGHVQCRLFGWFEALCPLGYKCLTVV